MSGQTSHEYEKGDNKAGGGGLSGGGGKRGRPQRGWEKGDVARDIAEARPEADLPRKPGRRVDHEPPAPAEPDRLAGLPVLQALRLANIKMVACLRKLEDTHRPDEREVLLRDFAAKLAHKRNIEHKLLPLVDHGDVGDALDAAVALDHAIDDDLSRLQDGHADDRSFAVMVQALYGDVELRLERERDSLMPAWIDALDSQQAIDLARDIAEI